MKAVCRVAFWISILGVAASAQQAPAPAPREYRVECYMVHVPARAVVALMPELRDETKAATGWEKLRAMIERGEATLADCLVARGIEGKRIVARSFVEVRYATEFEDVYLPRLVPVTALSLERLKHWPYYGITPSAFDTREVGPSLAVTIRRTTDPRLLQGELSFQHVQLEHHRIFDAGPLPNGERVSYGQTDFTELRNEAALLVESGRPRLLGVHRLPRQEATFEVVMLTVTARPPPASPQGRAETEPRRKVHTEVQMIALPQAQGGALAAMLRNAAAFPAADARLQEMLATGEAELLGWPVAEGFGRRGPAEDWTPVLGTFQTVEEVRSPVEYTPPQLPGSRLMGTPKPVEPPFVPPQSIHAPTAFDTRNTGPSLAAGGRFDARNNLELQLEVSLDWLAAMEPVIGARENRTSRPSIEQPRFRRLKTQARLLVQGEAHRLLGTFFDRSAQPRVILFLLHVRVQPAPQPL